MAKKKGNKSKQKQASQNKSGMKGGSFGDVTEARPSKGGKKHK